MAWQIKYFLEERMFENTGETRKLCLVASKGSLDMAYPPLILANAALMSGIEAHLFCTFWGLDIVTKAKQGKIRMASIGNPNFTMAPYLPHFYIPTWMGCWLARVRQLPQNSATGRYIPTATRIKRNCISRYRKPRI